jgi:hypothetical protein
MVEPVLIHLGEIGIIGRCIGLWLIPENLPDILPYIKGAADDDGTLVPDPQGKPVDMIMAQTTDNEDPGRGIAHHLAVHASGDPVDLEDRECEIFGTEFTVPLNGNLKLSFLRRSELRIFGWRHDPSQSLCPFTKEVFLPVAGEFFDCIRNGIWCSRCF